MEEAQSDEDELPVPEQTSVDWLVVGLGIVYMIVLGVIIFNTVRTILS